MILKKSHLAALERYHRKTLRQLMSLPERTATEAIHLLMGLPPITAIIHQKALSLLGSIARAPESLLHQIGLRQPTIKDMSSNSWFTYMYQVTEQYDLPSPHALFQSPIPKTKWKNKMKKNIENYYNSTLTSMPSY